MKFTLNRMKARSVGTLLALLVGLPIVLASSAQASETQLALRPVIILGCTAIPLAPLQISDDFWTGVNRAQFRIKVTCPGGRVVVVKQRTYEVTAGGLTELPNGRATYTNTFILAGTTTDSLNVKVPNTPSSERVQQRVQFTVYDADHLDGLHSTSYQYSSVLLIS